MQVLVINFNSYDFENTYTFTIADDFEVNLNNALRFLKDARRQHRIPGKAFVVKFPGQVYYFHRRGKDEYRMWAL